MFNMYSFFPVYVVARGAMSISKSAYNRPFFYHKLNLSSSADVAPANSNAGIQQPLTDMDFLNGVPPVLILSKPPKTPASLTDVLARLREKKYNYDETVTLNIRIDLADKNVNYLYLTIKKAINLIFIYLFVFCFMFIRNDGHNNTCVFSEKKRRQP